MLNNRSPLIKTITRYLPIDSNLRSRHVGRLGALLKRQKTSQIKFGIHIDFHAIHIECQHDNFLT